ncbi:hypothetical protein NITHO_150007 [Nitrolancea hollandica Lb]|uniref:Uncharacterized protein n=1 Tax=Nitrolancea hollandica Lb TaxID=1129897 RepID=I4EDG9_9BACT|nr:hypothetical protein NITHO_150007 [Nitrolancea hollandica Lb]
MSVVVLPHVLGRTMTDASEPPVHDALSTARRLPGLTGRTPQNRPKAVDMAAAIRYY